MEKHILDVDYKDKDKVKALGAKWDKILKIWYALGSVSDELKAYLPAYDDSEKSQRRLALRIKAFKEVAAKHELAGFYFINEKL